MGLASRFRIGPDRVEVDHLAVELGFILGPQGLHGQNVLAHLLEAGLVINAVIVHLLDVPAAADAEDETTARHQVETGDRIGGDDGVALWDQADAGADAKLGRRRGCVGQDDEGIV